LEWVSQTDQATPSLFTGFAWQQTVLDSTSALDLLLGRQITHYSSDFLSALDNWSRAWVAHLTLVEMLAGVDTLSKQVIHRPAGETTFAQDTLATLRYRLITLSESHSATDTVAKQSAKSFIEALSASDAVAKQSLRTLFESMSQTDRASATRVFLELLQESLSATDSVSAWVTHPGGLPHITLSIALLASALGLQITLTPVASGLTLRVTLV
jgi:hypothetical protein